MNRINKLNAAAAAVGVVPFTPPAGMSAQLALQVQASVQAAREAYAQVGHTDLNVVGFFHTQEGGTPSDAQVMTTSLWVTPLGEKLRADELRELLQGEAADLVVCGAYGPDGLNSFFCYAEDASGQWLSKTPLSKGPDGKPALGAVTLARVLPGDTFHNILYPVHA